MELSKFDEILAKFSDLKKNMEESRAPVADLDLAKQVRFLRTAHALLQEPVTIKPGDIVRGRKELAEAMIRDWDKPHILIAILGSPITLTINPTDIADAPAAKRYDCIVGALVTHPQRGGQYFLSYYGDLRDWELFPGIDALNDKERLS